MVNATHFINGSRKRVVRTEMTQELAPIIAGKAASIAIDGASGGRKDILGQPAMGSIIRLGLTMENLSTRTVSMIKSDGKPVVIGRSMPATWGPGGQNGSFKQVLDITGTAIHKTPRHHRALGGMRARVVPQVISLSKSLLWRPRLPLVIGDFLAT
jgi:hypothetical protein